MSVSFPITPFLMVFILWKQKGSAPILADDFVSKKSQSDLLKQMEEKHRKEIEREKMEKEKYQREIEEMKQKFSQLPIVPSSPLEVN